MRTGFYISCFMILCLIFMNSPQISPEAKGSEPAITLSLDKEEIYVDVCSLGLCRGNFTGTISCNMSKMGQDVQSVKVELRADGSWPTAITPSEYIFEFGGPDTVDFTAVVGIPAHMEASRVGIMIIECDANLQPSNATIVTSIEGAIRIKPYTSFITACYVPYYEVESGSTVDFTLYIRNLGNSEALFSLEVSRENSTIDKKCEIFFPQNHFIIDTYTEELVLVRVIIPKNTPTGTYLFYIKVTSVVENGFNESEVDYHPLFVRVENRSTYYIGIYSLIGIGIALLSAVVIILWKRRSKLSKKK